MEQMPYRPEMDLQVYEMAQRSVVATDWRSALPVLAGTRVVLRELQLSDAASLHALLTTEEVARFISPPPSTIEGFERFIAWTQRQRTAGLYACYAVTLDGFDTAIGIFQVRQLASDFSTGEWGFALGSPFWGTGVFAEAAQLVLAFAFDTVGVHRLEARAALRNGRGNGALLKCGAVQEAVLRGSLERDGEYVDQALYAILGDEWRARRSDRGLRLASVRIH
jgi:ribosomal-protein-alanine N-acetyltransferase